MIRSVGRAGPVKVAALVTWELRFNLLAMVAVAAVMVPIPDTVQTENATAVLSVLGICATIFLTSSPWLKAGGFQLVHAAEAAVGWSSNSSRFPAGSCVDDRARPAGRGWSSQAVTASPAANMFLAAFTSACSARAHWVHRKTAWLSRDFGSICPHNEQRCDVYAAGTFTTAVPV